MLPRFDLTLINPIDEVWFVSEKKGFKRNLFKGVISVSIVSQLLHENCEHDSLSPISKMVIDTFRSSFKKVSESFSKSSFVGKEGKRTTFLSSDEVGLKEKMVS
jgi:hypothetical protein